MSDSNRWGSPLYQPSNKVVELKQVKVKLPFTIIEVGDKDALMRLRQSMAAKEVLASRAREERLARAAAIISKWIEEQNAPLDIRSCECGAESCSSAGHSSWCPVYKLVFTRHKTSQTSY